MAETVPSAIATVEDMGEQSPSGANGLKRRQSEGPEEEQENKRQRTSPGKTSPEEEKAEGNSTPQPELEPETESTSKAPKKEESKEPRRKRGIADEKQRSKRLFGALLGNLNQPGDRVSKRRTEIEQRRKAELQKQDDERLEDRQRRLEKLAVHRKKEQIRVDEETMHIRHKSLLNAANFFQTKAEPKIYYRPWDLLPDEEDRIDDQIKEARTQIDKELIEWEEEKRKRLDELNGTQSEGNPAPDSKVDDPSPKNEAEEKAEVQAETDFNGDADKGPPADTEGAQDTTKTGDDEESEPTAPHAAAPSAKGTQDTNKDNTHGTANNTSADEPTTEKQAEQKDEAEADAEDEGDHVVEGDEDTVIY